MSVYGVRLSCRCMVAWYPCVCIPVGDIPVGYVGMWCGYTYGVCLCVWVCACVWWLWVCGWLWWLCGCGPVVGGCVPVWSVYSVAVWCVVVGCGAVVVRRVVCLCVVRRVRLFHVEQCLTSYVPRRFVSRGTFTMCHIHSRE